MSCKPQRMEMKLKNADLVLFGALLAAGLLILLVLLITDTEGKVVRVQVGGEPVKQFSLTEDVSYAIEGTGGKNLLRIENGSAWIEEADCPDGLCVKMGKIHREGQSVVCLPHQVVVEIIGESDENSVDAIVR